MGIAQIIKDTFSGDSHNSSSNTPGSFPSDDVSSTGKTDHAPSGTHEGSHGNQGLVDRAEDAGTGHDSHDQNVGDRNVMDPSDRKHGSNVMDTTGRAGDPATGASTRLGEIGEHDRGYDEHHHSKLHKKNDPRGHEDDTTGIGSGGLLSRTEPRDDSHDVGREGAGHSHHEEGLPGSQGIQGDRYGAGHDGGDITGAYGATHLGQESLGRDTSSYVQDTTGYGRDDTSSQTHDPSSTSRHDHDAGHGIYNTVTGHGSHEDPSRQHRPHPTSASDDSGIIGGTHVGSQDLPHRSHDTTGTSSARDDIAQQYEGRHGGAIAGLAGTGAGGVAAHEAGQHDSGYQVQQPIGIAHSTYDDNSQGHRSYDIQNPGSSTEFTGQAGSGITGGTHVGPGSGSAYDNNSSGLTGGTLFSDSSKDYGTNPGITGGTAAGQDPSRDYTSGTAGGPHIVPHGSSGYGTGSDITGGTTVGGQEYDQEYGQDQSRGLGQHGTGSSSLGASALGAGTGIGIGSAQGSQGYGPDRSGEKVLHKCTHCGNDDDISHYFKKEPAYRTDE